MNHMKILIALVVSTALLSGCNLLRNTESEEERQAPRLLDTNENVKKTWYCYGENTDEWNCRQSPDPSLAKTIAPDRSAPDRSTTPAGPPSVPGSSSMMGNQNDAPLAPAPAPAPASEPADPIDTASRDEPRAASGTDPLLSLPEDHYTVQLIAEKEEEDILAYARTNGISDPLYTQTISDGNRWYVLLLGTYPDRESATRAREEWLTARSLKTDPWVRRLGPLQQAIRLARAGD